MKKFSTAALVCGLCLFFSSCVNPNFPTNFLYDNADDYSVGNATITGNVSLVDVAWINGTVKFETTDADKVSFVEKCSKSLSNLNTVHYYYDSKLNTLSIKYCGSTKRIKSNNLQKDLTVYIPSSYSYLTIKADVVSSDVISAVPFANKYDVNTTSGKVDIQNARNIVRAGFNTVSGNISLNCDSVTTFTSDTVSGNVKITTNDASNVISNSTSGSLTLNIPSTLGFCAEIDSLAGKFNSNASVTSIKGKYSYLDEKMNVEFNSLSGNLNINVN